MEVKTDSERVRTVAQDRPGVPRLVGRPVDSPGRRCRTATSSGTASATAPTRRGSGRRPRPRDAGERDAREAGHHHAPPGDAAAETVAQPVKVDNDLYVRDYSKCILCYKCVEACGEDAQNTFAIAVAGRGFDARISTEFAVPLPDSRLRLLRQLHRRLPDGRADVQVASTTCATPGPGTRPRQTVTDTICPYCGVGCALELHVQDDRIVKVTSPLDSSVTHGHLCVKGRFGFEFVQLRPKGDATFRESQHRDPGDAPAMPDATG